jgi:predicted CXXCH cytochrome family protein
MIRIRKSGIFCLKLLSAVSLILVGSGEVYPRQQPYHTLPSDDLIMLAQAIPETPQKAAPPASPLSNPPASQKRTVIEDTAPTPRQPLNSLFSSEKMLEAYQNFMKMTATYKKDIKTGATQQAKDNPIWKFHGWLQQQIEKIEETGAADTSQEGIEGLCFVCHNGEFVVNYNFSGDQKGIRQVFELTSRHPVIDSEKSKLYDPLFPNDPTKSDPVWERKIQCTTCHNPGVVTGKTSEGGYPLTLPTEPELPYTQKLIDGWPTLDNPPWPHDTPPKPLIYGRPYKEDPDPDEEGDEVLGPDETELPDFTTFCQTCHRQIAGRYGLSNNYSRLKYDPIRFIKGDGGGVVATHGLARGRESASENLKLREPFYSLRHDEEGNVIANLYLSCTDCHEPHGSENPYLIRTMVNGKKGIKITRKRFFELCNSCHYIANPWPGGYPHGGPGDMRERNCIECHNHSSGGGRF